MTETDTSRQDRQHGTPEDHARHGSMPAAASIPQEERERWAADYQEFVHTRMARVQAAAAQWLTTMTALLGVFSAVVVVGGSTTIDAVPVGWPRWSVLGLAAAVYALTFAAVYQGAQAGFGGLGVRPPTAEEQSYERAARALQTDPPPEDAEQRSRELARTRRCTPPSSWWYAQPLLGGPDAYAASYELITNTLRTRLHRSRVLGIAAAVLSGVLAWMVLLLHVLA